MKISYLSGPANVKRFLEEIEGREPSDYFGTNYMKSFLELRRDLDARAQVFAWYGSDQFEGNFDGIDLINWPIKPRSGVLYHWQMIVWNTAAMLRILIYRPDIVLLTGHQSYWWIYAPLRLTRAKFIFSFHCVQWPRYGAVRPHVRLLARLTSFLVLRSASAVLSTSRVIRKQVEEMLDGARVPIFDHLPSYEPEQFSGIKPPVRLQDAPFETLFMGRLEANKGIFDVVEIARQLEATHPGKFLFHICGEGSQGKVLADEVGRLGLADQVILQGHCGPDRLRYLMSRSHACIAPTRSDFEAGFEMVCAEAILSGRPLVSSQVCPAIDYVGMATVEVPPDDVEGYRNALLELANEAGFYRRKEQACVGLKDQFFDISRGWKAAFRRALAVSLQDPTLAADGNRPEF